MVRVQVADAAEAGWQAAEAAKDQLCEELNMLVQQSVQAQLDKFEQLRSKLEVRVAKLFYFLF